MSSRAGTHRNAVPVPFETTGTPFLSLLLMCTPLRDRICIERLSKLVFASLVGPPLDDFKAATYDRKWLHGIWSSCSL
jgi:hypothetical protein